MPRDETPASVPLAHTPALLEAALASCLQKHPAPASAVADVRARKLVPFFPAGQAHAGTSNKADNIKARYGPLGLRRVKFPCQVHSLARRPTRAVLAGDPAPLVNLKACPSGLPVPQRSLGLVSAPLHQPASFLYPRCSLRPGPDSLQPWPPRSIKRAWGPSSTSFLVSSLSAAEAFLAPLCALEVAQTPAGPLPSLGVCSPRRSAGQSLWYPSLALPSHPFEPPGAGHLE